jgi:hypothetical protein
MNTAQHHVLLPIVNTTDTNNPKSIGHNERIRALLTFLKYNLPNCNSKFLTMDMLNNWP